MIVTTAQLFKHAYGKYAVGAYNINNAEQAMGLFRGCVDSAAPFIIQISKGARRYTGCQFSFTCDGSFERRRTRSGWVEARKAAKRALEGYVFAEVGTATHYHTDWVVPYWSGSLAKIAQVETHIFYR